MSRSWRILAYSTAPRTFPKQLDLGTNLMQNRDRDRKTSLEREEIPICGARQTR